uniref:Putative pgfg repeat protein n=1 Tax=Ixodes ricinus TaxID=34613 RepID=A0A0K8R9U1_IXORI
MARRACIPWAWLAVWTVVCCGVLVSSQTSYSVSSYHSEHYGPDGIIMGRSGYKDSTGNSRFTKYHIGKDGKRRLIADDPEGDIESRSLLPDPSKLALPGIPGFDSFSNPEAFFRALGIPKEALLPPFFPKDLLPPSVLADNGGFPNKKNQKPVFPEYRPT